MLSPEFRWHPGGGHHGPDAYARVDSGLLESGRLRPIFPTTQALLAGVPTSAALPRMFEANVKIKDEGGIIIAAGKVRITRDELLLILGQGDPPNSPAETMVLTVSSMIPKVTRRQDESTQE